MTKKMVKMSFRVKVVDFSIYLNILRLIIGTKIKDILMNKRIIFNEKDER